VSSERHQVAKLRDGGGVGIVVQANAHYAIIELYDGVNRWRIEVDDDEYDIIGLYDIGIGYKEIT
jgi:hypothetical protein